MFRDRSLNSISNLSARFQQPPFKAKTKRERLQKQFTPKGPDQNYDQTAPNQLRHNKKNYFSRQLHPLTVKNKKATHFLSSYQVPNTSISSSSLRDKNESLTTMDSINLNTSIANIIIASKQINYTLVNLQKSQSKVVLKGDARTEAKKHRLLSKPRLMQQTAIAPNMQFSEGRNLGSGQFGSVSMVQHALSRSMFAMKKVRIQGASEKLKDRVTQQIKIQMYLKHQNCLEMYTCYRQQKDIVMLLELGDCTLFDVLRKRKFFTERETAQYLRQVMEALKYIHSEGVIHRDIKPENIVLVDNKVKLADFGWAIYSEKKKRTTFCGTLDYVCPELVVGCEYDETVDLWSIGVLCYELCTGHAPFDSNFNVRETYKKILDVDVKFPRHLSLGVKSFINGLLVKIPSSRMTLDQALNHPWMQQYQNGSKDNK